MDLSTRQFADIVVAAPSGRIDHAAAGGLEQALAPLLAQAGSRKAAVILDFASVEYISSVGLRVLMIAAKQMRGVRCPDRGRRAAADRRRDLRNQPLRPRPRHRSRRFEGAIGQLSATALAAYDAALTSGDAMKRIRFWGTRGSLPVSLTAAGVREKLHRPRCAARRAALRVRCANSRRYVDGLGVRGRRNLRRAHLVRRDRDRRSGVRAVRSRQRRASVRPGRDWRATARRRRRRTTSSCPTCTGTTSWGCRSSRRPTSRATAIRVLRQPSASSRRRCAASRTSRRFRSISRTFGADIEFVHLEPGRRSRRRGHDGDREAAASRRRFLRLPLRVGRARSSSTRPIPSTSSSDPAETERLRRVLPRRRRRDLRRDVLARRGHSVKADWGHSSNVVGVELCQHGRSAAPLPVPPRARERRRHDRPRCSPTRGASRRSRAPARRCSSRAAYDGMEIEL